MPKLSTRTAISALMLGLFTTATHADSRVFLLQLGSFESETEAQTRWLQLKEKYPQLLEGLNARALDVTLPPDNFTVYRTQAGVLSSRSDAQIICDRLTSRGDECYVVETAMFQADAAPAIATAPQQMAPAAIPAPAAPPAPVMPAPAMQAEAEYDEIDQALVNAQRQQPAPIAAPVREEKSQSFWSWLNPFSGGEDEVQAADQVEMAQANNPGNYGNIPQSLIPEHDRELQAMAAAQSRNNSYRLPPPPAAPANAGNYAPRAAVPAAAPAMPGNMPFQVKRDGQPITPPAGFIPGTGDVKVAEAVRVPVTDVQRMSPTPGTAAQLRALGMPSAASAQTDLWAEIQYFASQQSALTFWDAFRHANPSFPPVRVRITNPYLNSARNPAISLRVGPFENESFIADICHSIPPEEARCRPVKDLGASTTARYDRSRGFEARRSETYRRQAMMRDPMYWVQMGAFQSPTEAEAAWRDLKLRHEPLLNDMQPDITAPAQGSDLDGSYRLRTGPFPMRPGADALCRSLQMKGSKCLTVFSH